MGNEISYNRENLRQLKCHRCSKSSFDDFKSLKKHVLENHIVEDEAERKDHNEMFKSDKNENVVSKKRKNGSFNEDTTSPTSVKKPRASMRRQSSESRNDENVNNDLSVSKNETPPTGEKKTKPRRDSSLKDSDVSTLKSQSDSPTVGNRRRLSPRNRSESESPNDLNVVAKPRTTRRKLSEESESSSKHDSSLATDKSDATPKTKSSRSPKSHNDVTNAFSSSAKKLNRLLDDEKSKPSLSKDTIVKKLKVMTDEDFIKYNIGEKYDEMEIYRRARLLTPNDDCVKVDEFKPGKIAWAQWRKIWWPCVIEKYWKSDSKSKNKVVIRYYEHENGLSPIFKLDTIKVELFFRNKGHFNFKTMAPIYEERRYDFFVCYTSALEDFVEDLENEERLMAEKTQKQATAKSGGRRSSSENGRKTVDATPLKSAATDDENANKKCIEGKWYTIEEIKAIATGPNSKQMEKVINKREEYSQKLIKLIKSQECKDHLCAIMNETKDCERHEKYKSADARTRRKELAFVATGPLVLTHQTELVNMLKEICPASHDLMHRFSTYDYDVLYPEAVIWALQKMHRTAYARAEARYKSGFELDDEERLKHACNRILNEENEKEGIAAKEAVAKTSPKSHDSSNVSSMSEMSNANDDNGDLSSEESFPMLDI